MHMGWLFLKMAEKHHKSKKTPKTFLHLCSHLNDIAGVPAIDTPLLPSFWVRAAALRCHWLHSINRHTVRAGFKTKETSLLTLVVKLTKLINFVNSCYFSTKKQSCYKLTKKTVFQSLTNTGFPLFGIEIQVLFNNFQGLWNCIFKDQFSTEVYSMDSITAIFNIYFCDYGTELVDKNKPWLLLTSLVLGKTAV